MNLVANALIELGKELKAYSNNMLDDRLSLEYDEVLAKSEIKNPWFIKTFILQALDVWSDALSEKGVNEWLNNYTLNENIKNISVIGAGNIPLVAFHDCISVLASGHNLWLKCSTDDEVLLPFMLKRLTAFEKSLEQRVELKTRGLQNADALIATGSNNSSRYFEYYFRHMPKILRKNRSSVAVIPEDVTDETLQLLADDMFSYFGKGCRSVGKLFVHENFNIQRIFENSVKYSEFKNHNKYVNNFDYHRAIYLMNQDKFLENDFFAIKESENMHAPVGVYFYERFTDLNKVKEKIDAHSEELQVVSGLDATTAIGCNQLTTLLDYADGVDTMEFLQGI